MFILWKFINQKSLQVYTYENVMEKYMKCHHYFKKKILQNKLIFVSFREVVNILKCMHQNSIKLKDD